MSRKIFTSAPTSTLDINASGQRFELDELVDVIWLPTQARRGSEYQNINPGYFPAHATSEQKLKNIFVEDSILQDSRYSSAMYKHMTMFFTSTGSRHRFVAFSTKPIKPFESQTEGIAPSQHDPVPNSENQTFSFEEDDPAILVELLAQVQIVPFNHFSFENKPITQMDAVTVADPYDCDHSNAGSIQLKDLLTFMIEDNCIKDYHVWGEMKLWNIIKGLVDVFSSSKLGEDTYNECIHFAVRVWNRFKKKDDAWYRSAHDRYTNRNQDPQEANLS